MQIDAIKIDGLKKNFSIARKKLSELGYNVGKPDKDFKFKGIKLLVHDGNNGWRLQSHLLSNNVISVDTLLQINWANTLSNGPERFISKNIKSKDSKKL